MPLDPSFTGKTYPPTVAYEVGREKIREFADAIGALDPVHRDPQAARALGHRGVIAHGMYTMALAGQAVAEWVGDPAAVVDYGVRFTRPVVVPDDDTGTEVVVSGVVKSFTDEGYAQVELIAVCDGEKVLGMARALVRVTTGGPVGKGGR